MSTSEKRNKTKHIMVRVAPDELEALQGHAADVGLPVSTYLLALGLGRKPRSQASAHLINELRLLGLQQKALCGVHGGGLAPEYRAVIVAILAAIERIGG